MGRQQSPTSWIRRGTSSGSSRSTNRPRPKLAPILLIGLLCCARPASSQAPATFVVASTTSVQDSGLLDELVPKFERDYRSLRAKVVAVGSGEAMDLGRRGDADVLLVHSPEQEEEFMHDGLGEFRKRVMKNNFMIAGPASDPAQTSEAADAATAFGRIAVTQSRFLSRGDESGTHQRELSLWERAGIEPSSTWYVASGQGMAETLAIADEQSAYVLTDSASLRVMAGRISLRVLFQGDAVLVNLYSVIPVKDARNRDAALAFANWITGSKGQQAIKDYGVGEYGSSLFDPDAATE